MAQPVRGNSTKKQGGGTTAGITTVGGANSVMLVFVGTASGNTPTISDNKGNTWGAAKYTQAGGTGGDRMLCFALYNGAGGAGHTITVAGGGGADIIMFVEYHTNATGFEVFNSAADSSSPFQVSTSGATTVADAMVVTQGAGASVAATTTHACTPQTMYLQEQDYGTYWAFGIGEQAISATGTQTATWSFTPTAGTDALVGIIVVKGTSSGVTCTLAVTDATDTVSSTATVTVTATLATTDATDTLSATTTEPVTATLSVTDANDTLSSAAAVAIVATLGVTDATDTLSSAAVVGSVVTVDLAVTDAEDTLAATTTSTVVATFAQTDAQDTLSSAAAVAVVASLAATDQADTLDSAVTTAGPVTCTLDVTDESDTLASQVSPESGLTSGWSRHRFLFDNVDLRPREAVLNVRDDDDTLIATARKTYPDRYVSAQVFDGDDGVESAAVVVPWPALELMREHRLDVWYPKTRARSTARATHRGP